MIVSELTKEALEYRKTVKKWKEEGYEEVGERGGPIWELHRGYRYHQRIVDVRIAPGGKELWIKIE